VATARDYGDLGEGRTALDLGCGTGMLTMGCAVVESDFVFGVDCDPDAIAVARRNAEELDMEDKVDFILAKVKMASPPISGNQPKHHGGRGSGRGGRLSQHNPNVPKVTIMLDDDDGIPLRDNCVDTVVTNPPFGTKQNAGMDVRFLKIATRLARRAVYSFHKTSTRQHLVKTIESWGYEVHVIAEMKFDIPNMYKFHQKKSVDVDVDLIRKSVVCASNFSLPCQHAKFALFTYPMAGVIIRKDEGDDEE
jgi:rRNA N6-adenosine-methyltransferase METTL5